MTDLANREVRLAHHGADALTPSSFEMVEGTVEAPGDGDLLVAVHAASLDPSHRIRMKSSAAGAVPAAGVVGEVLESNDERFSVGELVTGPGAWSSVVTMQADVATRFSPVEGIETHHAVGLLGLTGLTGYFGVTRVAKPEPGEVMVVTGAYGGVGQVACQIARTMGADVVGVVGGPKKVAAMAELGLRALDHNDPQWTAQLDEEAPGGVDVVFDNVWGATAARVVERLKPRGRVALCGQMSDLEGSVVPPMPLDDWFRLVTRSLTIQGFKSVDYTVEHPRAREQIADMIRSGSLQQRLHLVDGWEGAGAAFCDMLAGRTLGKLVVEVAS